MKLKKTKLRTARATFKEPAINPFTKNKKTVREARKRVLLKRTIRKSTGGKVNPGTSNLKALQRAVKMLKK